MNPSLAKILFTAASSLGEGKERQAFLDHACRDDSDLRRRLDELLEIQAEADMFFEFQPDMKALPAELAENEEMGGHIGRFRLIKRIGAGGCGTVYLAEQEKPVRRKVALKIVKVGMDTKAVIARFELERQALAQMDHPNIARVLEAGETASGRPYFVMELVEGERITAFCDAHRFSIRQRLELFMEICRAIQHAHQKGVIHQDIKPSNILMCWSDGAPVPKVIDFGIAKATGENMAMNPAHSARGHFMGTPAYMSPEQVLGGTDVDTRTDIYSLGILLYELVSGRPPFDPRLFMNAPTSEIRRVIQIDRTQPPSGALKLLTIEERKTISGNRGTTVPALMASLTGDLDWIVMKTIEKDRLQRYDTATGLAMDIRRFLTDQPVLAHPPSTSYVLGKAVRRNKLFFVAGIIAFVGLAAGFGISTWLLLQERKVAAAQALLRRKAEIVSQVSRAAVKINYGDLPAAANLLKQVPIDQTPSSLEAAGAFRAVGEWHVRGGRIKEAGACLTALVRAISTADDSDLPSVSFDFLPAAAAVAHSGDEQSYEEIRRIGIDRFGLTSNPVVAEQTLKGSLILPAGKDTLKSLAPLMATVAHGIDESEGPEHDNPSTRSWACFAVSLMHYRCGEYPEAARWADRCLLTPNQNYSEERTATMMIIYAMIEYRLGHSDKARAFLTQGRAALEIGFASNDWASSTYWFDWINALVLLREAESLIDHKVEDLAWFEHQPA